MTVLTKTIEGGFSIKTDESGKGKFKAYGNTFGNVDHAGDKTMPGAFKTCIDDWKSKGEQPQFLTQHGHKQNPLGIITKMEEDENGLLFEGEFCLETQAGREAYALVKMGALKRFSIGYLTVSEKKIGNVNELHELYVKEISLVTFACNENSLIQTVKSQIDNDEVPTARLIQKTLQSVGLSKRQAEAAVNGIKNMKTSAKLTNKDRFEIKSNINEPLLCIKSDNTMSSHIDNIIDSVLNVVLADKVYAYVKILYMDSAIIKVFDDTDDDDYKEYYVRVPYSFSSDNKQNIMVGKPETVVSVWLNESELEEYISKSIDTDETVSLKEDENLLESALLDVDSWFKT